MSSFHRPRSNNTLVNNHRHRYTSCNDKLPDLLSFGAYSVRQNKGMDCEEISVPSDPKRAVAPDDPRTHVHETNVLRKKK
jgi:hypothetical protein